MSVTPSFSRREFVISAGLAAAAAGLAAPRQLFAKSPPEAAEGIVALMRRQAATAKITSQPLRGGVTVLVGAGGNIAVLTGRDGKVLVDAGISTARRQIADALSAISAAPTRYLINSHWHFDHTDGNEWLHADGALIVAQDNTRKRLAADTRVDGWSFTFPTAPAAALPVVGFNSALTLHLNDTTIALEALHPAHTDSDILVEFKEPDIMHVGDIWWNGHYPFIDYSTGGSIDGTIRAVEASLAKVTDKTLIVPGHGPVGDKAQLAEFRDMLATVRQRVAAMKQKGQSLAEVIAEKPTLEFDPRYGHFLTVPSVFVGLVYEGV